MPDLCLVEGVSTNVATVNNGDIEMNLQQTKAEPVKPRKSALLRVRMEQGLADRLRRAANESDISASDKLRRILDQVLPQNP